MESTAQEQRLRLSAGSGAQMLGRECHSVSLLLDTCDNTSGTPATRELQDAQLVSELEHLSTSAARRHCLSYQRRRKSAPGCTGAY